MRGVPRICAAERTVKIKKGTSEQQKILLFPLYEIKSVSWLLNHTKG